MPGTDEMATLLAVVARVNASTWLGNGGFFVGAEDVAEGVADLA